MSRAERAKAYFLEGYACSQAVALAFSDVMQMEESVIKRMLLPFGGGMGRLRLTCGAVSGMAAVIGAVFTAEEKTPENKKEVYSIVQMLCEKFKQAHGSLICAELLSGMNLPVEVGGVAEPRTETYYKKRSCGDIVYTAAEILERYLQERGIIQ